MIDNFSQDARRAVQCARTQAEIRQQAYVDPAHLLIGLIEAGGLASQILESEQIKEDLLQEATMVADANVSKTNPPETYQFSAETRHLLKTTWQFSQKIARSKIRDSDLLVPLLWYWRTDPVLRQKIRGLHVRSFDSLLYAFLRLNPDESKASKEIAYAYAQTQEQSNLVIEVASSLKKLTEIEFKLNGKVDFYNGIGSRCYLSASIFVFVANNFAHGETINYKYILEWLRFAANNIREQAAQREFTSSEETERASFEYLSRGLSRAIQLMDEICAIDSPIVMLSDATMFVRDITDWLMMNMYIHTPRSSGGLRNNRFE